MWFALLSQVAHDKQKLDRLDIEGMSGVMAEKERERERERDRQRQREGSVAKNHALCSLPQLCLLFGAIVRIPTIQCTHQGPLSIPWFLFTVRTVVGTYTVFGRRNLRSHL